MNHQERGDPKKIGIKCVHFTSYGRKINSKSNNKFYEKIEWHTHLKEAFGDIKKKIKYRLTFQEPPKIDKQNENHCAKQTE